MAETKKSHHYFGAALSHLINNGFKIAIIESLTNINIYSISTDTSESKLFMKYRAINRQSKKNNSRSWDFSFSAPEIYRIWGETIEIEDNTERYLLLVCSQKDLKNTEFVLLDKKFMHDIFFQKEKISITIRIEKHKMHTNVHLGKSKETCLQLPRNIIDLLK